jgi:hypothetical protein
MLPTLLFGILSLPVCIQKVKSKVYKGIILPVASYGCETCSVTLREEHRLKVSENRMLRRIFGPMVDDRLQEAGKNCIMSFVICTLH